MTGISVDRMVTDELERRANSIELEITKPIPAPRQDEPQPQEAIDPKYLELLAALGFTEIPTAEQVKAKLDERRAEIRANVMEQADQRSWCDDGTRAVCANLRLTRPGKREHHDVKVQVTFDLEFAPNAFTPETAAAWVRRHIALGGNVDYIRRGFGANTASNPTVGTMTVTGPDGTVTEFPGGAA